MSGEIVRFPLGSSMDAVAADVETISAAIREGLTGMIIIGVNEENSVVAISSPEMSNERMHYLLAKATSLVANIDDETEEEDVEED